MKFIVTIEHIDNSSNVFCLEETIEESIISYGLDPTLYDLNYIKANMMLTTSINGDYLEFKEIDYCDGKLNRYLRRLKLKEINK